MDYLYENLGAEKFQEFCQALLVKEYSNVQCFPVPQADGGRDILSYFETEGGSDYIMMQVKFSKNPGRIKKPHEWLTKILKKELPKIKDRIPKGAKKYIIITNVSGTAKPDRGSIDKVDLILKEYIPIPAMCLWRDDLSRRLDGDYDLKWLYPELMSGPDVLRAFIEGSLKSDVNRRLTAVNAFMVDQYTKDKDVKFKQIDLENDVFELFIDVPIDTEVDRAAFVHKYASIKSAGRRKKRLGDVENVSVTYRRTRRIGETSGVFPSLGSINAMELLSDKMVGTRFPKLVIEGAPGQGKSTIVQYLCQLHRARLLNKKKDLIKISDELRKSPLRIPLKADLKDLSVWLAGNDPFSPISNNGKPKYWADSLVGFLAALVRYHSGGADFKVDDLYAIAETNHLLIVLDGLDEVADIESRRKVVEVVEKGVEQLDQIGGSLQVIITSRPAAFVNSPGLSDDNFAYFQLGDLTRELIGDYTEKWIKAGGLKPDDGEAVIGVLDKKIEEPHIRELARNPMQLAILLNLIHKRGTSLPEKRTALYSSYMELFFDREAEKDEVVREHRDVLIQIHQYLAWVLHSEAETEKESGRVSTERLNELLKGYLLSTGHNTGLTDILFKGMVERVVALVSRVEGTYEFEVQTLREYFAACYLYETAPHSSLGDEKPNTIYERFIALALNRYWLNVTRFYAGCYGRGELPSLIDGFNEMVTDDNYGLTNQIPELIIALLSDWVFAQSPKDMSKALKFLFDINRFHRLLMTTVLKRYYYPAHTLSLPTNSGKEELTNYCMDLLIDIPPKDIERPICSVLAENSAKDVLKGKWLERIRGITDSSIYSKWLKYGYLLDLFSELTREEIGNIYKNGYETEVVKYSVLSDRFDYLEYDTDIYELAVRLLFNKKLMKPVNKSATSILGSLYTFMNIHNFSAIFEWFDRDKSITGFEALQREFGIAIREKYEDVLQKTARFETERKCKEILSVVVKELERNVEYWVTSSAAWDTIIENIRCSWGDNWLCYELANLTTPFLKVSKKPRIYRDLLDNSVSLMERTRYARSKTRARKWWEKQLNNAGGEKEKMFVMLTLLTTVRSKTLIDLLPIVDDTINEITEENYDILAYSMFWYFIRSEEELTSLKFDTLPDSLEPRTVLLLSYSLNDKGKRILCKNYISDYSGGEKKVTNYYYNTIYDMLTNREIQENTALDVLAKGYAKGHYVWPHKVYDVISRTHPPNSESFNPLTELISEENVQKMLRNPKSYPVALVALAEQIYRGIALSNIKPLMEVANENEWFEE